MTTKDIETLIEQYEDEVKESGVERPLDASEVDNLNDFYDNIPEEYVGVMRAAYHDKNFGEFETLPRLLRNYLGALELRAFREKFGENPSLESEQVRQYLDENSMNAALRAGISAEKNKGDSKESAMALDTYMSGQIMKKTMMPPSDTDRQALMSGRSEDEVERMVEQNMARQRVMAKTMFLAQLGKYDLVNKNGATKELDVPMYETLVHGSRTNFILPVGEKSGKVLDAFMSNNGADAGIAKRTAATHSVKRRKIASNGTLRSETKEEKTFSPFKVFSNQYGMNLSVGGIGSKGPGKNTITGDGTSGHMYMRVQKGDKKHCGSLLVGIEGSEPGKSDGLGNSHDFRAKSAKQSAFLADKSIVGKKVGGRQVDLSGMDSVYLAELLNEFSQKYGELQRGATTKEGREKIANINDMLMGRYMDEDKLKEMFSELGMNDKNLSDTLLQSRGGYTVKIAPNDVGEEEFKRSVRATITQDKACKMATERFESAGDDLALSVGAVRELMLTHETRSLGWKIRHPIKNLLEYLKIRDLTKRLQTEKDFRPADISGAFSTYDDTFSMDWGEGLSYDRDTVDFVIQNKHFFKKSENRLSDVLKEVSKAGVKERAEDEVTNMQEELRRVLEGKDPDREQIVVNEEDEANKSLDVSFEDMIPDQPEFNKTKEI